MSRISSKRCFNLSARNCEGGEAGSFTGGERWGAEIAQLGHKFALDLLDILLSLLMRYEAAWSCHAMNELFWFG